jgi:hypothetical protein
MASEAMAGTGKGITMQKKMPRSEALFTLTGSSTSLGNSTK